MDLVEEEDRFSFFDLQPAASFGEYLAHVLHSRRGGRHGYELGTRLRGDQASQSGLSGSRRSPEDHGNRPTGLHQPSKRRPRLEQLWLADHLVEVPWSNTGRQRSSRLHPLLALIGEEVVLAHQMVVSSLSTKKEGPT